MADDASLNPSLAEVPAEAMVRVALRAGLLGRDTTLCPGDPMDIARAAKPEASLPREVIAAVPLRLAALLDTLEDGALPEIHTPRSRGLRLPLPRKLVEVAGAARLAAQGSGLRFDRGDLRDRMAKAA